MTTSQFIIAYLISGIIYGVIAARGMYMYLDDIVNHREVPDYVLDWLISVSRFNIKGKHLVVIVFVVTLLFFPVLLLGKMLRDVVKMFKG